MDREKPPAASDNLRATWIGHSSFLVQLRGVNILTDPIWSNRASPVSFAGPKRLVSPGILLDDLPPVHITLLSHDHYDHLDDVTVRHLVSRFPQMNWIVPLGLSDWVMARGARLVHPLDWWDEIILGDAVIGCTPAQHFSGRLPWNRNSTLWCG